MKYIIIFVAIFSTLNISANSSYNSDLVRDFIDEMHDKHNFDKEELQKLFNTIKEEKKLKKFFKKAPERRLTWNGCELKEKKCINYKGLFVNKSNIENGRKFMLDNSEILKKSTR